MAMRWFVSLLVGAGVMAACGDQGGPSTADGPRDRTPPAVVSVLPADSAVDVPLDTDVRVTFSEPINTATVAAASFFVTKDGEAIAGTYAHDGNTAVFQPDSALDSMRVYQATVTAAVRDPAGNPLPESVTWSFTTGVPATPTNGRDR